jgi:hypothetical protein
MNIKKLINWKLYFILLIASIFSTIAIFPYALTIQANVLENIPISLPLALFLSALQTTIMFAILIYVGLKLSKKLGLEIPLIEKFVEKKKVDIRSLVKLSILW